MLLTSLLCKHMYSYISETNFDPSNEIILSNRYTAVKVQYLGSSFYSLHVGCIEFSTLKLKVTYGG